jgi:hypothetical protein
VTVILRATSQPMPPDLPAEAVNDEAGAAPVEPSDAKQSAEPEEPPPAAVSALEPPSNWKPADKDMFKTLPEPARQFLLERHRAMHASHTRKMQAIAKLKREYEPVEQVFAVERLVEILGRRGAERVACRQRRCCPR